MPRKPNPDAPMCCGRAMRSHGRNWYCPVCCIHQSKTGRITPGPKSSGSALSGAERVRRHRLKKGGIT